MNPQQFHSPDQFQQPQFNNNNQPGQFQPPNSYYPPLYQTQFNPQREQQGFWSWFRGCSIKARLTIIFGAIFLALFLVSLIGAAIAVGLESSTSPSIPPYTTLGSSPVVNNAQDTPTSSSTPTLLQVVQNSGQYDCCLADAAANVSDLEATETSDGTVMVLANVVNLPSPANPVDVGKVLIFQYMAAVWTSPYHAQNVTVTVMYQGNPAGAITATLSQATEQGTEWSKTGPFDYWGVYDSTDISPSLS